MAMGGDQELTARLRTKQGETWGALSLYREPGAALFGDDDKRFVQAIGPRLAAGAQRAMIMGEATDPELPDSPGLVVLGTDWEIVSESPTARHWMRLLPDGDLDAGRSAVLCADRRPRRALGPRGWGLGRRLRVCARVDGSGCRPTVGPDRPGRPARQR